MRAAAVLLAVLAAAGAGCMCGPSVYSVEGDADLPARLDGANRTTVRHAFEEAGYSVEDDPGASLVARNGTETVFVSGRGEGTNVHLMYDVPHREFRDNEAGSGAARDYIAREAARVQPQANATVQRIAGALGLGGVAAPTVGGTYAIC